MPADDLKDVFAKLDLQFAQEDQTGLRLPQPWVRELLLEKYSDVKDFFVDYIVQEDSKEANTVLFRFQVVTHYFVMVHDRKSPSDTDDPLFKIMLKLTYLDLTPRSTYNADALWAALWEVLMTKPADYFIGWFNEKFQMNSFGLPSLPESGVWVYEIENDEPVDRFPGLGDRLQAITQSLSNSSRPAQKQSGGCFVATAVYGSYDCPEVWVLRRFRDESLANTAVGRLAIRVYYATSPLLLRALGRLGVPVFRNPVNSLVRVLERKGFSDAPYAD